VRGSLTDFVLNVPGVVELRVAVRVQPVRVGSDLVRALDDERERVKKRE
jgi:hypothetical protein